MPIKTKFYQQHNIYPGVIFVNNEIKRILPYLEDWVRRRYKNILLSYLDYDVCDEAISQIFSEMKNRMLGLFRLLFGDVEDITSFDNNDSRDMELVGIRLKNGVSIFISLTGWNVGTCGYSVHDLIDDHGFSITVDIVDPSGNIIIRHVVG